MTAASAFIYPPSMHENRHLLEFLDENGALLHSTGWQEREAGKYCITKSIKNTDIYNNGFLANETYMALLTVQNYCGDLAVDTLEFVLPDLGCNTEAEPEYPIDFRQVVPNPFSNEVNLSYEVFESGALEIKLVNVIDPSEQLSIKSTNSIAPGLYQESVATNGLPAGIYALVVHFQGQLFSLTLVKN